MIGDAMPLSPKNFSFEDISSPGPIPLEFCDDTDFFLNSIDSDLPSFPPAAAASGPASTSATVTTNCGGGGEGQCCYVDDSTSYTFLFDSHQPYDTNQLDAIQLPIAPIYDQEQFQQSLCADAIAGGCYSSFAPDSLAGQHLAPEYGESLAALAPMPGYVGLDPMPQCSFLDTAGTIGYYQDTMGMGLFSRAMMLGLEPDMVADGGGVPTGNMQMTGDCQNLVGVCSSSSAKPLPTSEISALDNVCRLTAEQRKEKIHRYLKKKNERNFSKKIKYACRKTLADNRPRVRGRFAKNDEHGEVTIRAGSSSHEYDDYEVGAKEDLDVLSPDTSTYRWCDLLEIQLQS